MNTTQTIVAAAGGGIGEFAAWAFYLLVGFAGTYFLGAGILKGMKDHWKKGEGAALKAIGGGVLIAIVIAHIVSIRDRANRDLEQAPGGYFGGTNTHVVNNRGW